MTTTPKERAAQALAEVKNSGRTVEEAVGIVAALAQVAPEVVVTDVRQTRYLVYNASCPGPDARALLADLPADVVPIPYGWTATDEEGQQRLLQALAAGISHLPSLFAWEPPRTVEGEDGPEVLPAGYREVRIPEGGRWSDDAAPADRLRPAREWALHRTPPPFEEG